MLCAGRLCSPGSLGSGAVGAWVLCGHVPAVQLSVAGRCCSTAAAVVGVCLDCISIAILLNRCFLARCFAVAWLVPLAGACWPGFGEVLRAWVQVGPWPSGPPHAYLVAGRPPPVGPSWCPMWGGSVFGRPLYLRWTALVLRLVCIVISAARVARCAIQHSVSYCVEIKFYASIQRVSEQFPN